MIYYERGDIFEAKTQVIVNPVNCKEVMGKGLAAAFKARYGAAYFAAYQHDCRNGRLRIGRPTLYTNVTPWIMNFPTKQDPGQPSRIEYIEQSLHYFAANWQKAGITSIAFPRLGTGQGKLSWEIIKPIMARYLAPVAAQGCIVYIYIYDEPRPLFEVTAPASSQDDLIDYDGPYPPPRRACYICGQTSWIWDPEKNLYQCGSGDPEHEEERRRNEAWWEAR